MISTPTSKPTCPHCGRELEPLYAVFNGKRMFCGIEECQCPGACEERDRRAAKEVEEARLEREARRSKRLAKAGIPRRFIAAESEMAEGLRCKAEQGTGAYIVGNVGTGKTHLACAVAVAASDEGAKVRFADSPGLLASIRATYGDRERTEDDVVRQLVGCDLLVIDDLGKEQPTEWTLTQLFRIIDGRYAAMRPLVVTSQYERPALARRLAGNGDAETARALVSRLLEMCERIELTGPDRRIAAAPGDES